MSDWQGDNPFFLYVRGLDEAAIDLDEPGWLAAHSETIASTGMWHLVRKTDGVAVLTAMRLENDLLRYTKRVFVFPHRGNLKLATYGFIRERNGRHEEMWYLPFAERHAMGNDVDIMANAWAFDSELSELALPYARPIGYTDA